MKAFYSFIISIILWFSLVSNSYSYHVISNPDCKLQDTRALYYFSMRKSFCSGGKKIKIVTYSPSNFIYQKFTKDFLKIDPNTLKNIWDIKAFSGLAAPIIEVDTEDEMIEMVKNVSGAIGYIINDDGEVTGVSVYEN